MLFSRNISNNCFSVAAKCDKNLMTVSNLGVCFGPTLLRPEEETVASIMDLKFYNIVVEILIENYDKIFNTEPSVNHISEKPSPPTTGYTNNIGSTTNVDSTHLNSSNFVSHSGHTSPVNYMDNQEQQYVGNIRQYSSNNTNNISGVRHASNYSQPLMCVSTKNKNN